MWLFTDPISTEWDKGKNIENMAASIEAAIKKINFDTLQKTLSSMDDSAKTLQKTMSSGMVFEASNFREQLFKSYRQTLEIGGTFADITEAVGGFSTGMNKIVFMTNDITKNGETFASGLVALEKTTNITSKDLGTMASDFIRIDGSQIKSLERMQDIAKVARSSGLNSQALLKEVKDSLSKIDSYGFKGGIDGLTKMAAQAQLLRTSVDNIGALSKAQDFWDPEKAIDAASKLQMLGGAIGDLGNPFKLMNMGMNDVGELQDQMVKLAANAFKIDKETGEIGIDNLSRQRLKEQADIFGKSLEEYTKIGREAKKAQEVMNTISQTSFGEGMPKESKDLLASLTEFKGGKMVLDIPGFKTDDLESAMVKSPSLLKEALESYQKTADMTDRQIAEKGLTLQESLDANSRVIRDTVVLSLNPSERNKIVNALRDGIDTFAGGAVKSIDAAAATTRMGIDGMGEAIRTRAGTIGGGPVPPPDASEAEDVPEAEDATLSSGKKLVKYGKNQIFSTIPEDEGVFMPNLLKKLDFLKNTFLTVQNFTESLPTTTINPPTINPPTFNPPTFNPPKMEMNNAIETANQQKTTKQEPIETQKVEASGDINININVNTSGTLTEAITKDPRFLAEFKDRVVTTIKNMPKIIAEKGR